MTGPVSDAEWDDFVAGRNPTQGMMADGTPVVHHFDPNFGVDVPNPRGGSHREYLPHAVKGGMLDEPEVYEPRGNCVTCGRPTWNTIRGNEIPGHWEDSGNAHSASDYDMHGPDIAQCVNCANDYDTYNEAIRSGQRPGGTWHHPGARINSCDACYDNEVERD